MLFLTGMSIAVGVSANDIAATQLTVEKTSHQPVFKFDRYNDPTDSFVWLSIYNNGFPTESIETCKPIVLFQIHYGDEDQSIKSQSFILEGFYDAKSPILTTDNELFKFGNVHVDYTYENFNSTYEEEDGNLFKYEEIARAAIKFQEEENFSIYGINIPIFVHIKYTDIYGDTHEGLYSTSDATLSKIPDDNFEHNLKIIQGLEDDGYVINLDNWSSEQIYGKLMED